MSEYSIFTNPDRCIACHACELACRTKDRSENKTDNPGLGQMVVYGPELVNDQPAMSALFLSCFQCEQAWCMKACPADALRQREDGIIYVNEDLCFGCRSCIMACPWHIPQWDALKGVMSKCDLCSPRTAKGYQPACVQECPTGALSFAKTGAMPHKTRQDYGLSLLKREIESETQ